MFNIIKKNYTTENFLATYSKPGDKIINVGCGNTRYGNNCTNVDIVNSPNVNVVCDIENLPFEDDKFDIVICNAVLQYCKHPRIVAGELYRVLKPGGFIFIDAPFVQAYCKDTPDRFRFSYDAMIDIFCAFQIKECKPSISSGSAFAFLGIKIAQNLTKNKYLNFVLFKIATMLLWPLRYLKTVNENNFAGAFYLIGRK